MAFNKNALINDFTAASEGHRLAKILAIRAVERISGQHRLKKLYLDYQADAQASDNFWLDMMLRLNLSPQFHGTSPDQIPTKGSLLVVANHPYGVLDGMALCGVVAQRRRDFKIMINHVLARIPEMHPHVLPINFDDTQAARETNLASRKQAEDYLKAGGAVLIFPAGGISTTQSVFQTKAEDAPWGSLTGKLVNKTQADVLPIYFDGQNSQLFQKASHMTPAIRWALMYHEVYRRKNTRLDMVIGEPISYAELKPHMPPKNLATYLRAQTFNLAQNVQ